MRIVFILIDEIDVIPCTHLVSQLFLTHCRRMVWCPATVHADDSGALIVEYASDGSRYSTMFLSSHVLAHSDSTSTLCWRVQDPTLGPHHQRALAGVVVAPKVLQWAQCLNPVDCCHFLGVPLKNGSVPCGAILSDSCSNAHMERIVADAAFLLQLCEISEGKRSRFADLHLHVVRDEGVCNI